MFLIETSEQLNALLSSKKVIRLVIPVKSDNTKHELINTTSFIYCRTDDDVCVININHIDAKSCQISRTQFEKLISEDTLLYGSRYYGGIGIDYEMAYFDDIGVAFSLSAFTEELFRNYKKEIENVNDCIPVMKWVEKLNRLPLINPSEYLKTYTKNIKILGDIERSMIKVDSNIFPKVSSDFLYTKYNPYTTTGRPSNTFGGINWSALNKNDGIRDGIISRWNDGKIVSIDYESYHLRLIAKIIGYEFPKDKSAHGHLSEFYACDYETAKAKTFRYLYGGFDEFALKIPFFKKCSDWIEKLWQNFIIHGKLITPVFGREIKHQRIESPTPQKVFNYFLQSLETETNYKKLKTIMDLLSNLNTKLILYTYDAILLDTHPNERKIINHIKEIMETGGFPVRIYEGKNYGKIELIN